MLALLAGSVTLAIWICLILGRGGFWRLRPEPQAAPAGAPSTATVAAIIPARNEADVVGCAIASLLAQQYAGRLNVFLVDDESTDRTVEAAVRAAAQAGATDRLTIVRARSRPAGWMGKVWAQAEGLRAAEGFGADFFLLTDADIEHGPREAAELVARAETGRYDLVSLMARLSCEAPAERALIPAFVYFFFMLYPPSWVSRKDCRIAAASGGCMLLRRKALERLGGMEPIRSELIDDCALARAVKQGGTIWLGAAVDTRSLRRYSGWREIGGMIARTAFYQLRHSVLLLAATLAGMALTFLAPLLLLLASGWLAGSGASLWPAVLGGAAWLLMAASYWPTLRYYRCSLLWAPLLPLIATFYMGATVFSAMQYWRGAGGIWKGRVQDSQLRDRV
jgi:hopene-associated glycosyltransferase HpnB